MAYLDLPLGGGPTPNGGSPVAFFPQAGVRVGDRGRPAPAGPDIASHLQIPVFRELETEIDAQHGALWCHMRPAGPPSFTRTLLGDLLAMHRVIANQPDSGLRYFIGASRLPGIFNLGGDLVYFVDSIRTGDRERLRNYAIDCCKVAHAMASGFGTPIVTIALVQGDALGGGFEGALSFQVLVAEKSARLGLPEVLFNLFPGMGAYSLLARKVGAVQAQRMIMSGKVYTGKELFELGVVDILAEDGDGEAEVRRFMAGGAARYRVHQAMRRVAQRYDPLTLEELCDITDIWVDTAMQLEDSDLRKMERLALAQHRRLQRT